MTNALDTFNYGGLDLPILNQKDDLVPVSCKPVTLSKDDKKALAISIKENMPALLIGETGTGKTSAIKELAYLRQQAYSRVNMTGFTTPDELIGSKSVKDGATYYENGIITNAMKRGAILVIDEINATTPDCLFILHGLLDEDRQITLPNGEVIKPHKDFRVFATCNPDYEGTRSMNKAFLDRFPIILSINTLSPALEKKLLVKREKITEQLADNLVTIATMVRKDYIEQKITTFLSTRTLLNLSHLIVQGIEPEKAYSQTVMLKTQNKEEQKILMDFFFAVFKIAGTTNDSDTPTIITKGELSDLEKRNETLRKNIDTYFNDIQFLKDKNNNLIKDKKEADTLIKELTNKNNMLVTQAQELSQELKSYKIIDEIIKKAGQKQQS